MQKVPFPQAPSTGLERDRSVAYCAGLLLFIHSALLGWGSYVHGPNLDEPAHLATGISYWTFGRFDLYNVNPPLVRFIASAPVLATHFKCDWTDWRTSSPYNRTEFHVGRSFVLQNGPDVFWYFTLARWACIPLCLIGAWTAFLWARDLYGDFAGLLALWLYCFCPNLIAWGASITPDAIGASLGTLAAYTFWRWLQSPCWRRAILSGLTLGAAELAKGTWIILFMVFPVIWFVYWISTSWRRIVMAKDSKTLTKSLTLAPERDLERNPDAGAPLLASNPVGIQLPGATRPPLIQLVVILLLAVYLLNLGYGFEGTLKGLGEYRFVSRALSGEKMPPLGANRFANSLIGWIPVPLPENYFLGLDSQKLDFERGNWSYLCGEQRHGGWWYYYLAAYFFKSPVGTVAIFAVASGLAMFCGRLRADWRSELALLLPTIAVMALVSSQTGFNRYLRYALPFAPFAYIHCSRIAIALNRRRLGISAALIACTLASAIESLSIFPHSMSFFNQLAGGPKGGHRYLLDANIDWAQDILFLKKWYDANPQARPFHFERFGSLVASPEAAGIESTSVPGYRTDDDLKRAEESTTGPRPGWFALSINPIQGYRHYDHDRPEFTYFQRIKPIAQAGFSIYIYHLTLDDANALREELGLKPISAD